MGVGVAVADGVALGAEVAEGVGVALASFVGVGVAVASTVGVGVALASCEGSPPSVLPVGSTSVRTMVRTAAGQGTAAA